MSASDDDSDDQWTLFWCATKSEAAGTDLRRQRASLRIEPINALLLSPECFRAVARGGSGTNVRRVWPAAGPASAASHALYSEPEESSNEECKWFSWPTCPSATRLFAWSTAAEFDRCPLTARSALLRSTEALLRNRFAKLHFLFDEPRVDSRRDRCSAAAAPDFASLAEPTPRSPSAERYSEVVTCCVRSTRAGATRDCCAAVELFPEAADAAGAGGAPGAAVGERTVSSDALRRSGWKMRRKRRDTALRFRSEPPREKEAEPSSLPSAELSDSALVERSVLFGIVLFTLLAIECLFAGVAGCDGEVLTGPDGPDASDEATLGVGTR